MDKDCSIEVEQSLSFYELIRTLGGIQMAGLTEKEYVAGLNKWHNSARIKVHRIDTIIQQL